MENQVFRNTGQKNVGNFTWVHGNQMKRNDEITGAECGQNANQSWK